jgi:2,4-dienoyl-CoA reductase-like NADH-dependent reductase (Old Yellow Enzyme family)
MWRPPERIRYQPRPGRWPTAAEAAASRLFSPITVGPVTLTQRTWVPAMVPWRASEEGLVTPEVLDWYACFARGRPGAIVVEATGIRDVASGPLLRIGHDRFVPGLLSQGPFGRNLGATAQIRAAVRAAGFTTPVIAAGGIHSFEQAEAVLAGGQADIVGFARQALADPDWFRKVAAGRGADVRLCLYTNYCEALDQRHRQVTCELWDREALDEPGVSLSADRKRRLTPPAWTPPP